MEKNVIFKLISILYFNTFSKHLYVKYINEYIVHKKIAFSKNYLQRILISTEICSDFISMWKLHSLS